MQTECEQRVAHAWFTDEGDYVAGTFVAEGDRRQFLEAVTPGNIIRNTENKMIYSVPFRRVFDNGIRYYRLEFSKLHLDNENINFVVGFKDVDDEVRKDLRHR